MPQMNTDGIEQEGSASKDPRTYAIIGAAIEVHRQLGRGFLEGVYHEALVIEFGIREIPFAHEVELQVRYKGRDLACSFKADFVCFDGLIVEIKSLAELTPREHAQIINYLRATGMPLGLLINFGAQRLEYQRFIDTGLSRSLSLP